MTKKFKVSIREFDNPTNITYIASKPVSERIALSIQRGANINLDHNKFYVELEHVECSPLNLELYKKIAEDKDIPKDYDCLGTLEKFVGTEFLIQYQLGERIWVWKNQESNILLTVDQGNTHCEVLAIKDNEVIHILGADNVRGLTAALHKLRLSNSIIVTGSKAYV